MDAEGAASLPRRGTAEERRARDVRWESMMSEIGDNWFKFVWWIGVSCLEGELGVGQKRRRGSEASR